MTVLSTAYFPPIIWMAYLYQKKEILIDTHETYAKQSYRNRTQIATATGAMNLSIPVKKPNGNQTKTFNIQVDTHQKWASLHWKSIKTAYQSAPFFLFYQDEIEAILKKKFHTLIDLNEHITKELASMIGFQADFKYSEDFIALENAENDFRFHIHPKKQLAIEFPPYYQIFDEKHQFIPNLSILDLLFNLGPESISYLESLKLK